MHKHTVDYRGVTLIELMVIVAVGALVLFFLTSFLITYSSRSEENLRADLLWEEGRLITSEIADWMRRCTLPENIGGSSEMVLVQSDELTLPAVLRENIPGVISIGNEPAGGKNAILLTTREINGQGNIDKRYLGRRLKDVDYRVSFSYASEFDGFQPRWSEAPPEGSVPALVRVSIALTDRKQIDAVAGNEPPAPAARVVFTTSYHIHQ